MARALIQNTKIILILIKPSSLQELAAARCMSKLARRNDNHNETGKVSKTPVAGERRQIMEEDRKSCWIPHTRTGIYFPTGQEWVLDDVPNEAASFDCTFWMRRADGVDKPEISDNYMHRNPN